jgi:hypothetical protein
MADFNLAFGAVESSDCPITKDHRDGHRRTDPLYLEVRHNRREELIIWAWGLGFAIHQQILDEFKSEGFTGYRTMPATVRFRDGSVSNEYYEFLVTGWAGMVSQDSGVHLVKSCPACCWKEYSAITNYQKVIDWNNWTGEDFFIAWPIPGYRFVTARVAQWLLARKPKSFRLEEELADRARDSIISKLGFGCGRLTNYLPEDLANRYGKSLGLL